MAMTPKTPTSNHILSRLSAADHRLLKPHLEPTDLPVRKQLEARNKPVKHIYFMESGFASVVAKAQHDIEVGIIGREGMSGLSVVLGSKDAPTNETYIQIAGSGQCMEARRLSEAIGASASLHQVMLRYAHDFLVQTTQTALANGRSKIEERLARWLLMAADRVEGELPLTHEFLAIMLGVRRSGVSMALQEIERTGLISHRRGYVTILDREGLVTVANGIYSRPGKSS
jgi:CRP-like cAMP-binding protein